MRQKILAVLLSIIALAAFLSGCASETEDLITDISQLTPDTRVAVTVGSTQEIYASEAFNEDSISRFNLFPDALTALLSGQTDAVLGDYFSGLNVAKTNPAIRELPGLLTEEHYAVGLQQGREELLEKLNEYIAELAASGGVEALEQKWLYGDDEGKIMDPVTFSPNAEPLILGTDASIGEPFVYMDENGQFIGYEVELLSGFAAKNNMWLEVKDMSLSALIPALQSGTVDVIACGLTVTEEREKSIDFSDSYVTTGTAVLVRSGESAGGAGSFWSSLGEKLYQNFIYENRYMLIINGLGATVAISVLSVILGILLGMLVCAGILSKRRPIRAVTAVYSNLMRCTPILVLLMIIFYVVFNKSGLPAILIASIAFGLNESAYMSEIFASAIRSVDRGQIEAARSMGFSSAGAFRLVTLPQATRQAMPLFKSEFISLVKTTSIVGYVAIQDLTKAGDLIRSRTFEAFLPLIVVAIIYILLINLLLLGFRAIEAKTAHKRKGAGK